MNCGEAEFVASLLGIMPEQIDAHADGYQGKPCPERQDLIYWWELGRKMAAAAKDKHA